MQRVTLHGAAVPPNHSPLPFFFGGGLRFFLAGGGGLLFFLGRGGGLSFFRGGLGGAGLGEGDGGTLPARNSVMYGRKHGRHVVAVKEDTSKKPADPAVA